MKNETAKKKESSTAGVLLDPDRKSPRAAEFEDKLSALIVGQERAVRRMSGLFQIYLAGMNNPSRPIGTMLFLGPTGSGKTRVVEAASTTRVLPEPVGPMKSIVPIGRAGLFIPAR